MGTPGAPPAGVCGSEAAALPRRLCSIPLATPRARPHRRTSRLSARASAGCRVGNKGGGRGAHGGGAAVRPSFGARDVSGGGRGPCDGGGHGRRGQRGPGLRLARAAERAAGAAARSRHEEERLRQAGECAARGQWGRGRRGGGEGAETRLSRRSSSRPGQGPPDGNHQSAAPEKVGWVRKFCGKGIFREIWKNRYVVLKGDQLYVSEKEVGARPCASRRDPSPRRLVLRLAPPPSLQVQGSQKSCVCREKSPPTPRVREPEWGLGVYLFNVPLRTPFSEVLTSTASRSVLAP